MWSDLECCWPKDEIEMRRINSDIDKMIKRYFLYHYHMIHHYYGNKLSVNFLRTPKDGLLQCSGSGSVGYAHFLGLPDPSIYS